MRTDCSFFLGSSSPKGFCSYFDELLDVRRGYTTYILKGGPGCGKSSLMKIIATKADEYGIFCERIYCSSDEKSLDAVIIPLLKINVVDGTPPHTLEPINPGVSEQLVNLGVAWNREKLKKNSAEIIELNRQISIQHAKSRRYLEAAGGLIDDSCALEKESTDIDRIRSYVKRLATREIPVKKNIRGRIARRFLSAPTPAGLCIHYESIECLCERVIEINGISGYAASVMVGFLSELACERGYNVYLCTCPLSAGRRAEHLLIPELSLCFMTSQAWHPAPLNCEKSIGLSRFINITEIKKHRARLEFNQTASCELITEAMKHTAKAKELHDTLEAYYIAATNFSIINNIREELCAEIFGQ